MNALRALEELRIEHVEEIKQYQRFQSNDNAKLLESKEHVLMVKQVCLYFFFFLLLLFFFLTFF